MTISRLRQWRALALVTGTGTLALSAVALAPAGSAWAAPSNTPAHTWATNGRVNAILPVGDRIYVGGTFTAVVDPTGVRYPASNLAVFSASTGAADLTFQVGTDGAVNALATNGSSLFLGGTFSNVINAGSPSVRSRVAAIDPSTGALQAWAPSVSGQEVDTVAYDAATGSVYIGGMFGQVAGPGGTSSFNGNLAKVDAATGAVDVAFTAVPVNGKVQAIVQAGDGTNRLFLGGRFDKIGVAPHTKSIAAIDATTGNVDPGFVSGPTNQANLAPVESITTDATHVYVSAGGSGGACTALDQTTGAQLWSQHTNGDATSVALIGSTLYCGGHFGGDGAIAGQVRKGLAALDASSGALLPMYPVLDTAQPVWSLGSQSGDPNLYVGGDFTAVSGVVQSHFAMFLDAVNQGTALAPSGLRAQAGDGVVHLSWSQPSTDRNHPVTGFTIYRGTSPGGENMKSALTAPMSQTFTFDDTAVTNGTTYYYKILSRSSAGKGVLSTEVSDTPTAGLVPGMPGAPQMMAIANPAGEVDVSWNPPADNGGSPVTSYTIYRSTSPGTEGTTPYVTGVVGLTFRDLFNVSAGTTYFYVVAAVTSGGTGPQSTEVSAVETAGKPGVAVLSGSVSGGVVTLTWSVPPDGGTPITKYVITRDAVRLTGNVKPPATSFVDSTVTPGTHVYRIKALNAQGSGLNSQAFTITV
jgi:hypothetical protein